MGTHSSGHPKTKINAKMKNSMAHEDMSKDRSNSVSICGVPRLENTAPKKFDAATKNMIRTVISKVLIKAS